MWLLKLKHFTKHKFNNLYGNYTIGKGTRIGSFCDIGNCKIGKNCIISSYVFIPSCVEIKDNVFVGPAVVFTNDKCPPSYGEHWGKLVVGKGASIGARCVILPDVVIGENSLIGAGSVVTKSIPANEVWCGNPVRFLKKRWQNIL